ASWSWSGVAAIASTGGRWGTSWWPASHPRSPWTWRSFRPEGRQKVLLRPLDRAGGVDSTPSAAYHPLEPTTLIPVRAAAARCFILVLLEDTAMPSHIN